MDKSKTATPYLRSAGLMEKQYLSLQKGTRILADSSIQAGSRIAKAGLDFSDITFRKREHETVWKWVTSTKSVW